MCSSYNSGYFLLYAALIQFGKIYEHITGTKLTHTNVDANKETIYQIAIGARSFQSNHGSIKNGINTIVWRIVE